jgi:Ca2+-binding RTX toxin-like protein
LRGHNGENGLKTRTLQSLTATLALFGTSAVQASIITTDQAGGSEALLNLVNTVDSSSYTLDLGVKLADLNDGDVFPLDGGASAFINGAGIGNIRFAIIAADVGARQFVTSSADPNFLTAAVGNALRGTWTNSINELILNINAGDASPGGTNNGYGPIAAGPSPNYVGGGHDLWQGSVDNTGTASEPISIYLVTFGTNLLGSASKELLVSEAATLSASSLTIGEGGGGGPGPGDDTLTGTAGNDLLNGLAGADTMTGLAGNDTYIVDNSGDLVIEAPDQGTDTVKASITYTLPANVEKLILTGSANRDGTGNALANTLTGNSGNNILNGKAGADTMTGQAGNDTYIVDNVGDKAVESADGGTDLVKSSVTFTLGNNVENLTLTGSAAINGTGNTLTNVITGNSGNNTLNGRQGNDTLKGGAGQDRFLFNTALNSSTNFDKITDFTPIDDVIRLENAVFAALTTTGSLASDAFSATTSAKTSKHRILYDAATGIVRYDADGTGPAAAVKVVVLTTKPSITRLDFYVQ